MAHLKDCLEVWNNLLDEESYIGDVVHLPSPIHKSFIIENVMYNLKLCNNELHFFFLSLLENKTHTVLESIQRWEWINIHNYESFMNWTCS